MKSPETLQSRLAPLLPACGAGSACQGAFLWRTWKGATCTMPSPITSLPKKRLTHSFWSRLWSFPPRRPQSQIYVPANTSKSARQQQRITNYRGRIFRSEGEHQDDHLEQRDLHETRSRGIRKKLLVHIHNEIWDDTASTKPANQPTNQVFTKINALKINSSLTKI